MKKLSLIILSLIFFITIINTNVVFAGIGDKIKGNLTLTGMAADYSAEQRTADIRSIVVNIINTVLTLFGLAFVALVIYGGWLWMTAAGNQERVDKAKKTLQWAAIGILIVILSLSVSFFIKDSLISASKGTVTAAP